MADKHISAFLYGTRDQAYEACPQLQAEASDRGCSSGLFCCKRQTKNKSLPVQPRWQTVPSEVNYCLS